MQQLLKKIGVQSFTPIATTVSSANGGFRHSSFDLMIMLFMIWAIVAIGIIIKQVTTYRAYIKYIKASSTAVDDPDLLNVLGKASKEMAINTTIELYCSSLIASPLIIGFFKPAIILPVLPPDEKMFSYIFKHELIHFKRRDTFYIWLTQIFLAIYWFNPLFYFVHKMIIKDRELSCDEAVVAHISDSEKKKYCETLLKVSSTNNTYQEKNITTALLENKSLLKERLISIRDISARMKFQKSIKMILSIALISLSLFLGTYIPTDSHEDKTYDLTVKEIPKTSA